MSLCGYYKYEIWNLSEFSCNSESFVSELHEYIELHVLLEERYFFQIFG